MRRIVPLAAVLALTLAACGDDGMSTSEYRAAAKKVCVDAEKATEEVKQPTRSTPEAIVDYLERLLAANERTTQRFEKLDPPEELDKPHADILAANREGAKTVRQVIRELEQGKDAREVLQSSTARLRELGQRSNDAAERLGVPECVQ
jgi:hypothetical protein